MDRAWVASVLGGHVERVDRIQSVWGGYGEILRVHAGGGTAVVKHARLPADRSPGTLRKHRSFEVETAFYEAIAPRCDATCRVAALRGATRDERSFTLVLEDLDAAGFARRTDECGAPGLDEALRWLASFHARFLGERIDGVWPTGTYWHLDTRRDELPAITDTALRDAAESLAATLATARHVTLLHGDAKDANFCFARDRGVAAVDFQYTGHGAGIIDVAYLLYGRRDEPATGIDEARLDAYFRHLRRAAPAVDLDALETEWRALYPIARLDFCRFLAGWRPAMWQADMRGQRFVRQHLAGSIRAH